jgi:actin-related protein
MEKIWEHTFTRELKVPQEERNILTSDSPLSPKMDREKMTQIMFEKFNVQGLFICIRPLLSMYCVGKTSALVVESGDDLTQIVPINEGYYFPYSITKSNLGGKTVTNYLVRKLNEKNSNNISKKELEKSSKIIKEKYCRVSLNYEEELNDPKFNEIQYKLPDGNELKLEKELFICPETLFDPNLTGQEIPGIPMQMYNSIMKCENEMRKDLYSNIILAGGNTLLNDFHERIKQEIQCLAPNSLLPKLKVIAQTERKYTAWIGGALISGLQNFQANWVTHAEYQEAGPQIIHRKCF